ncbi:TPA: hypothetical protein U2D13_000286 [Streptococcus suis]|uniref:hypothetical protein n=1 Tax=Streptococcus suis TaxID=1307 RepID=UPI001C9520C5|nr:hypothetical protein [Streptococcus suis]MBY5009666.1 hypothetical protein [Streptococcus suis]MDG4517840.1 hypothetical protein [Streptococcus suis]HEM6037269.1 hypothetical protein [Streptococcus suis]HEM6054418.1 hypothetical protein [Streptococcus suis]HEM6390678.1 hypothetical protein [Streptococcus suis]
MYHTYSFVLFILFAIYLFLKYQENKKQRLLNQQLSLNRSQICDDIENTCHRVSRELGCSITFSRDSIFLVSSTPTESALRYRFPLLIKDELDEEELLYLVKNLVIELDKKIKQNYRFYSQTQDIFVSFIFNNQVTKREQLNYLDLDIFFYHNQEELKQLKGDRL